MNLIPKQFCNNPAETSSKTHHDSYKQKHNPLDEQKMQTWQYPSTSIQKVPHHKGNQEAHC